ncbi:MAG TPA: transglutaminase domain-containing protein, partial [Chitinophagaceae bacterium]|nr:transglutaminase domain-containing protein [Chitinophagaceae bacterium]
MKRYLTICLLLLNLRVVGQEESKPGLSHSSQTGIYESPAQLSSQIIKGKTTDIEKVTAIFHWIAVNISYYRPYVNQGRRKKNPVNPQDDPSDNSSLPSLTERIASKVIKDRKGVCEGYARLFTSLCDHAGIQSAIITGYARTKSEGHGSKFRSNHTWNAVNVDGKWYLLDVTWASGFLIMPSGEFVRQYDPYYFLADPAQFIQHHYPDDLRWSLLENPPVIPEFRYTPFRQRSFSKYSI